MKVVLDTMLWVSYCTRRGGSRHRLIDRALRARVRLFVSDYILDELDRVLREDLNQSGRFVRLATGNPAPGETHHIAAEH